MMTATPSPKPTTTTNPDDDADVALLPRRQPLLSTPTTTRPQCPQPTNDHFFIYYYLLACSQAPACEGLLF